MGAGRAIIMTISNSGSRRHSSPKMDGYDAGVFIGWGTDTFDSWSQLHKCL